MALTHAPFPGPVRVSRHYGKSTVWYTGRSGGESAPLSWVVLVFLCGRR